MIQTKKSMSILHREGSSAHTNGINLNAGIYGSFVLILLILKKKTHLFDEVRKDDLAEWNDKNKGL